MIYRFGKLSLDTDLYRLALNDEQIAVEPQVFDLLTYLVENRSRVVARDELLAKIWKGKVVSDSALSARLKAARKAVGDTGRTQKVIKTIHGRGYQFVAEVDKSALTQTQGEMRPFGTKEALRLPDKPSIVVLPFQCLGGEAESEYFAEGLTGDITANLSHYRELLVIDHHSAIADRGRITSDEEFAIVLGVEFLTKGNIRRSGSRIRIAVQLVEAVTGRTLWADQMDREMDDLFALEDEIVAKVVSSLVSQIEIESSARAMRKPPGNMNAYDCVIRAKKHVSSYNPTENALARALLERAIKLDPGYATAYAYLSWSCAVEAESDWCTSQQETLGQAVSYARKALELDEFDSNAHAGIGWAYMYLRKYDLAEIHVNRAIECNPNNYHAYCIKTFLFALTGRASDVSICGTETLKRNPLAPDDCLMAMVISRYTSGDYDSALEMLERIRDPSEASEDMRAACLAQLGRADEACVAVSKAAELSDGFGQGKDWLLLSPFKDPHDLEHLIDGFHKSGIVPDKD